MHPVLRIAKALSDETRLRALLALRDGELCLCHVVGLLELAPSTVSKHLSVLKNAGIVEDERRGVMIYYRLRVPCILNFFGCVESVLKQAAKDSVTAAG